MNKTFRRICKISGIGYVLAWAIGLSSGGPSLTLNASGATIAAGFTAHKTGALIQFTFAEGIAGLMLLVLVVAAFCGLRGKSGALSNSAKLFGFSGIVASLISVAMASIGYVLILSAAPHGTAAHAKALNDLINRLDGPKMWLLGVMAATGVRTFTKLPKWHKIAGYALAVSLVVSGLSYGLLIQPLSWAAYVAGALLLVWVGSFGMILGSRKDVL